MVRLPNPGEDQGNWGKLLNEFLLVSHNDDGTIKADFVNESSSNKLASNALATVVPARPYYAPEDYGCAATASPSTNDAAILAAINDASTAGGIVQFIGRGVYNVSKAIDIDIARVSIRGNKTILQVDPSFQGSYFFGLSGSMQYPYNYNIGTALSGIILAGNPLGGPLMNAAAVQIGSEQTTNNSLFSVDGVYISGFMSGFKFIQNAWRIRVQNSRVTAGTAVSASPNLGNFGENMFFENCFFESYNPLVTIGTGEWLFLNCSFNSTLITATGNCIVKLQNCHLEPHTVYPCIKISHAQSTMVLENVSLIIDPAVKIQGSVFDVIDTNLSYGLIIRNLDTIQSANFAPETANKNCLLISGNGRVDMTGYSANTNGYGYALSKAANLLYNGSAEKGTTAGWTTYATYGGNASFSIDATTYKFAAGSLKLSVNASSTYVGQAVPCRPGQWLFAQCWNKLQIISGTANASMSVDFLSAKGDVIATTGYNNMTQTTDWTCRRQLTGTSPVAPSGTASVRVYIGLTSSGVASSWYDEVVLNVA